MPPTAGASDLSPVGDPLIDGRRSLWRDLLMLGLLGVAVFFFGLTDYGVNSFQEATRICVAYEMQQAGEWIVPTRGGEAYIAKPPMMYWVLMGVANLRGHAVGLLDARLAIAGAGVIGLLCVYVVARRMLATPDRPREGDDAAWWAALGLGTGILFVRAARIADLDMLLIPFVVVAIGAVHAAWRASLENGRTHWLALALATVCSIGAALTKGPVPTMVIGIGIYAAIIAHGCWEARDRAGRIWALVVAGGAGVATMVISAGGIEAGVEWPGVVVLGLMMTGVGYGVARALRPSAARAWWPHLWRTHPWLVLGAGLVAVALWLWLVDVRMGDATITALVDEERDDNLRLLVARSPIRNLGFFAYGILPMSLAGVAGLVWMVKDRPLLTPGQRAAVVWTVLGFVAFSVLGKGVARYLLPVWPGLAMVGGMWLVAALRDLPRSPGGAARWRAMVHGVFLIAALVNAWFYGLGRAWLEAESSPRDLVDELVSKYEIDPSRVGSYGFAAPALNFHLSSALPGWDGPHMYFVETWADGRRVGMPPDGLIERLAGSDEEYWLFVDGWGVGLTESLLQSWELQGEVVPLDSAWVRRSGSPTVRVVRVTRFLAGPAGDPPSTR